MAVLLGRTTAGVTGSFVLASQAAAWKFTADASGDVKALWWHPKVASTTLSSLELGIYSHDAGADEPDTKLGSAFVTGAITGTGQVFAVLSSPVAVTSGTTYWLAVVGVGDNVDFQGDNANPSFDFRDASAPLPASWGASTGDAGADVNAIIWGEDVAPPIIVVGAGAVAFGAAAGTTVAPAIPTHQAGDLLVAVRAMKHSTSQSLTTEANWTRSVAEQTGGTGSFAADTGPTKICIDTREAPGAGTTVTFDNTGTTNTVAWAQVIVLRKTDAGATWDLAGVSGTDNSAGAAYSVAFGSNPGLDTGDICVIGVSTPTDVTAAHWSTTVSLTATGLTAVITERGDAVSGNGNDIGAGTWTAEVTAGPASGNPTFAATASGTTTNIAGPCALVRVRAVGATSVDLTPATESDSAQALTFTKTIVTALTPAVEADAAQTLSFTQDDGSIDVTLTPATEADAANALIRVKTVTLTPASEADTAPPASVTKTIFKTLAPSAEADTAQGLSVTKTILKALTPATETDAAVELGFSQTDSVTLTPAVETDQAVELSVTKTIFKALAPAAEADAGLALDIEKRATLVAATETDVAVVLTIAGELEPDPNPDLIVYNERRFVPELDTSFVFGVDNPAVVKYRESQ